MLKKLSWMYFAATAAFAPMAAFADGPGGEAANEPFMNNVMLGHGVFGPILVLLFFTVAVGIIFIAIKLFVGPEEHHRPPPT